MRHRQSGVQHTDAHESSQQHLGDSYSHELVRSSTNLAAQGSSDGQSGHMQGQSGFITNERQVFNNGQSRTAMGSQVAVTHLIAKPLWELKKIVLGIYQAM